MWTIGKIQLFKIAICKKYYICMLKLHTHTQPLQYTEVFWLHQGVLNAQVYTHVIKCGGELLCPWHKPINLITTHVITH